MDLGISSFQINVDSRGFSFDSDGPLDMRMNQVEQNHEKKSFTAANIVNEWTLDDIANVLYKYGDETKSRQIAREIVQSRPLNTTSDLVDVISRKTIWKKRSQTLARCFQALRIAVNDEINALEETLTSIHKIIKPGKYFHYV
jgi:16S rRNA (cytosine1402-N4)-methyltransferase